MNKKNWEFKFRTIPKGDVYKYNYISTIILGINMRPESKIKFKGVPYRCCPGCGNYSVDPMERLQIYEDVILIIMECRICFRRYVIGNIEEIICTEKD